MPAPNGSGGGLSAPPPAGGGSGPEDARPGVAGASDSAPQPLRRGRAAERLGALAPPSLLFPQPRALVPARRAYGAASRRSVPSPSRGAAGAGSAAPAASGLQLGAPRPACAGSRGPCRARIYCALESPSPGLGPGGEGCFPPKSCPDGSWCLSCMRRVNAAGREAAVFLISFLLEHHSSPPDNFICLHLGLFLSFICKLATAEK